MIPLAKRLQELNCRVFIGAGEKHLSLFKAELPGLSYIHFPGFSPGYSRHLPQYLFMLFKTPLLLYNIIAEHYRLKRIVRENDIDIVISDNRFGLWNNAVTSVYVTHILRIPLPFPFKMLEWIGVALHGWVIRKYDYCLIPDLPGEINVSGKLSHQLKLPGNAWYIGILSRFAGRDAASGEFSYRHNTVILSGPEPQRSILRNRLEKILAKKDIPSVILEGRPEAGELEIKGNIISYSHLPASKMGDLLTSSENIITRSGYTSVMDLIHLNCSALLVPTPGQTEQEYLAEYLKEKGWFSSISQKNLNESVILHGIKAPWPEGLVEDSRILLDNFLRELMEEGQKDHDQTETDEKTPPYL